MSRVISAAAVVLFGWSAIAFPGCASMPEDKIIQAFADSLQKENLEGLREQTSDNFESKALHRDDSIEILKTLDWPKGKVKVVKVDKDKENDEERVTVQVGELKRKQLYRLKKDPESGKWVVDEVYLNKKELAADKAVTEQVNIQLALREFIAAWGDGDRKKVLDATTPEFGQILSELPPEHLAHMVRQVVGEAAKQEHRLPKAQIRVETADVRVPKLRGELVIKFRRAGHRWKADDVAVEARREGESIKSVRDEAAVITATLAFQAAYQTADKKNLARLTTQKFFEGSLSTGNLSLVKLPPPSNEHLDFEVKFEGNGAAFILPTKTEIVKIGLARVEKESPKGPPEFRVEEVTIYETNGTQDKRMSALFTSHAVMQLFAEALVNRDLTGLKMRSTADFKMRVWDRLTPATFTEMPLTEIHAGAPEILTTVFQGPLTQVTVNQGDGPLTYVLRDQAGEVFVDDVLVPANDRPESLKTNLELMIPLVEFSGGMRTGTIDAVRANSSKEFNKLVWNQVDAIPEISETPHNNLRAPLSKINVTADRALIVLGDDRFGAKIVMVKDREREKYVVDDVVLVSGPEQQQRAGLKLAMRTRVAQGK